MALFFKLLQLNWKSRMVYKTAYWLTFFSQILGYSTQFLTLWIMLINFNYLGQWQIFEVVFLFSIQLICYGLSSMFIANIISDMPKMVISGKLNDYLIKPLSPFWYMIFDNFNFGYIAHIILSAIMLGISIRKLSIGFSIIKIFLLFFVILCGAIITGSLMLISSFFSIIFIGNQGWSKWVFNIKRFINYPISIYRKSIQFIFTYILPIAYISFYPTQLLLNKTDGYYSTPIIRSLYPLISFTLAFITYKTWIFSLKRYNGASF